MKAHARKALRFTAAALLVGVLPGCSLAQATPTPAASALADETKIISVLTDVARDWNAGAYNNLKAHWDISDAQPIYLAEEADQIMTSWPQVEAYWTASENWIDWIVVEYSNYSVKRVDATNAMVTFDLRFDLQLNDRPRPIGGDNRAVVNLRFVDGEWKIHAWVEAPLSAMTYMRKLYEMNIREDLPGR